MYSLLIAALFASLPFFTIRDLTGGYSLTLLILLAITAVNLKQIRNLNRFELAHVTLMGFALFSVLFTDVDNALLVWLKTSIYLLTFIALKRQFDVVGKRKALEMALYGARIGVALYLILVFVALYNAGQLLGIFDNIGYFTFTFKIQSSIAQLIGMDNDISSSAYMRNSMGEVFAFFCVLPLVFSFARPLNVYDYAMMGLSLLLVLATFSRRALIAVALVTLLAAGGARWKKITVAVGFLVLMYFMFVVIGIENRFEFVDESTRLYQYGVAIDTLIQEPLTGLGYGSKVPDFPLRPSYVHNIVLSHAYMLGLIGFVITFGIFVYICSLLIGAVKIPYYSLLIIPLLGMLVGSTTEGLYTPVGWIVFALVLPKSLLRSRARNA